MPELAKRVTIDLRERKLSVDGTEFPWCISNEGLSFEAPSTRDKLGRVTLTILAEDVEVIPANLQESAENVQVVPNA